MNPILKKIALAVGAFIIIMTLFYFTLPGLFWGILNVLRIILIILLAILLLILLVFVTVILVPLKYRLKIETVDNINKTNGMIKFSWFLKLINGGAKYKDNKFSWYLKILNKSYGGKETFDDKTGNMEDLLNQKINQAANKNKDSEKVDLEKNKVGFDKKGPDEVKESIEKESIDKESVDKESVDKESVEKESIENESKGVVDKAPVTKDIEVGEGHKAGTYKSQQNKSSIAETKTKSIKDDIDESKKESNSDTQGDGISKGGDEDDPKIIRKIKGIIKKIQYTYYKICDKIKMVATKKEEFEDAKDKLNEFINDEIHRKAFDKLIKELKKLLRSLRPKEIAGKCKFGFEDPKTTGMVLAGISLIYPYIGESSTFEVDFENKVLSGKLVVAGKVRAVYFLLFFIRLIIRKYVRITIKNIIKFQKEFKTSEGGF